MKGKIKVFGVFIGCLLFRLIPFRAPNIEPIMASIMPVGRKYGAVLAFLFGFMSMALYDIITGKVGPWTWTTAVSYGIIGIVSIFYFKKFKASAFNFAIYALIGTIFFDFITGILFAPMFGETLSNAFILQIPFTALHLIGNIGFALTLSPVLNKWFLSKEVSPIGVLVKRRASKKFI
jgi:uncharacterized membrane protein